MCDVRAGGGVACSAETLATPTYLAPENRQERVLFREALALWETASQKESVQFSRDLKE